MNTMLVEYKHDEIDEMTESMLDFSGDMIIQRKLLNIYHLDKGYLKDINKYLKKHSDKEIKDIINCLETRPDFKYRKMIKIVKDHFDSRSETLKQPIKTRPVSPIDNSTKFDKALRNLSIRMAALEN